LLHLPDVRRAHFFLDVFFLALGLALGFALGFGSGAALARRLRVIIENISNS